MLSLLPVISRSILISMIRRYKKEDFHRVAQLIVSVFPTETIETYFVPAQYGKHAKGKLWDAYNNLRSTLASVGFIERRSRKCRPTEGNDEVFGA